MDRPERLAETRDDQVPDVRAPRPSLGTSRQPVGLRRFLRSTGGTPELRPAHRRRATESRARSPLLDHHGTRIGEPVQSAHYALPAGGDPPERALVDADQASRMTRRMTARSV